MALISLSDWLDRFGDAESRRPTEAELESIRIVASESEDAPSGAPAQEIAARPKSRRWSQIWRRAFSRVIRDPSTPA